MRFGNGQCTHLTMTRLYTSEYRCSICLRIGSMGWVYRCTQDRELLLEEDMEREKLDKLCGIFERPTSPRPRGPAARLSSMSFFDENSDEALESYSIEQLQTILKQRAHANDLASPRSDPHPLQIPHTLFPLLINPLFPNPDIITSVTPEKSSKPWLPLRGGECQFKVCHSCRPTCEIRSYLSLNGIANNDIPPTAITGFGFNLTRKRPVALVEHVKNLGLRKNPPPRPPLPCSTTFHIPRVSSPAENNSILGLGIINNTELPYRSKPLPPLPSSALSPDVPNLPEYGPEANAVFREFALRQPPLRHARPRRIGVSSQAEVHMVPLPEQTQEEIAMTGAPFTPMEELELDNGVFGSAPLEVNGGVAVMEESVDFRVADVVMQF
ncbi:uncharacterized protein K444DRAFT_591416 [Hyaloscypha bicolor E]|uniref:Uncharacterized protein n=1 Tax=Hyaloscypha bicolor E TaxID=1095630 RepID=A0A2J6T8C4_9HELO|nr:uncharacterized protein K444DRAFT_591416 [Hyaloscypha bicolor E]PMD59238.1 hypothetical protein K444DRAFT_591416 [Hyaloscypha bicolor E]